MKLVLGSPGTWSGMALRVSQCVFAAASVCAMVTAFGFGNYTAFWYFLPPTTNNFIFLAVPVLAARLVVCSDEFRDFLVSVILP